MNAAMNELEKLLAALLLDLYKARRSFQFRVPDIFPAVRSLVSSKSTQRSIPVRSVNPLFTFKAAPIGAEVLIKQDPFGSLTGSFHSLRSQIWLIRATLFSSFLFRSEANWASARFLPVLPVAGVRPMLSIATRAQVRTRQPPSFSVLFSEFPASI
jgi:hypothetical protein